MARMWMSRQQVSSTRQHSNTSKCNVCAVVRSIPASRPALPLHRRSQLNEPLESARPASITAPHPCGRCLLLPPCRGDWPLLDQAGQWLPAGRAPWRGQHSQLPGFQGQGARASAGHMAPAAQVHKMHRGHRRRCAGHWAKMHHRCHHPSQCVDRRQLGTLNAAAIYRTASVRCPGTTPVGCITAHVFHSNACPQPSRTLACLLTSPPAAPPAGV